MWSIFRFQKAIFLEDRKQHTTINKAKSSDKPISIEVPQGSILSPILFILFINDFSKAVEFSIVHHFADDTNLLLTENLLKHINRDLKIVAQWIRSNKQEITGKINFVIFKSRSRKITKHLRWKTHLTSLGKKLSRSVGLLSKRRHYVPKFLLRAIYYSIFKSHLIYGCEVWSQNQNNMLA